ncbi:MAG: hypothetical protein FGM24_04505 [Candidatus Kapabacteria bacterium]|nr:hypothetical protein [Candidatus Kapabacteria bacterium]
MTLPPGEDLEHGRTAAEHDAPDELDRLWDRLSRIPLSELTPQQREMCMRHMLRRRVPITRDPALHAFAVEVVRMDGRHASYSLAARSRSHATNVALRRERARGYTRSQVLNLHDLGSVYAVNPGPL